MAINIFRRLAKSTSRNVLNKMILPKYYSIYEPDYLEAFKPKYPLCPPLLVQLRAYDYPVLQRYQSWIHKIAKVMEFDVEDAFAMPAKEMKVLKFKPKSTVVEVTYLLKEYERNLKLINVPAVRLPIFLKVIEAAIPEGVLLDVQEFDPEKENRRYIPDKQLLDLKQELEEMQREKK